MIFLYVNTEKQNKNNN